MTIVYNLNLIKKNLILFIIFVIIFFSISYSLTSFQLKQTENLSSINLEIYHDRIKSRDINFDIEKLKIFFYNLTNAFDEVGATYLPNTNFIVSNTNFSSQVVQELRTYKSDYIDMINYELITLDTSSEFEYNNQHIIKKYFNDNFDLNHFSNFTSSLSHQMNNRSNLKSIQFKIFTDDEIVSKKYILFLMDVINEKIWKNYYLHLSRILDLYNEHFSNFLTISEPVPKMKSRFADLLINKYGSTHLSDFVANSNLKKFNYEYSLEVNNYKKSFEITQPTLLFFIIFSIIASFCLILLKEKIYKKN